jgi:PPOX class probable F420-dependent enzyme
VNVERGVRMSMMLMVLLAALVVGAIAHAGFSPEVAEALKTAKNLYVATERKDGSLSKVSPVWFMFDGEAVYFGTLPTSWKARRIRQGSPLHVWVGRSDGPHFVGAAELLADPALAERMAPVYSQKYWIAWLGLFRPNPERVRAGKTVLVKVHPPS